MPILTCSIVEVPVAAGSIRICHSLSSSSNLCCIFGQNVCGHNISIM